MGPLIIQGNIWRVVRVSPGDPFLIDRTGEPKLATADMESRTIRISTDVLPPMFDRVLLHEAAHAAMEETGANRMLAEIVRDDRRITAEELIAWFMEAHAVEMIDAVMSSLGRGICIEDICIGGGPWR